ncbi:MAG: hypothetical protein PHY04_02215 [Candidatus ainarchaeum sp.]|jgi:hypothetical protein|nr:hypothetical protein [Candidatus ainarchaeum sp.]MDD3085935.1 hypothetical protein [Candidatus ainarchaeum sp.]MDD4128528.1 hypothetical protein [Candidatus ainarchaeum sp.]MDD4467657.1 hypothetical protein [Candidatus ainarchaeum sp.]HPM85741.1 hypothetical protein [archaeon]
MKITKWIIILITFGVIIWLLFGLEIWAKEWKDLFFYYDNWILFIGLIIFAIIAKKIASWVLTTELKVIK